MIHITSIMIDKIEGFLLSGYIQTFLKLIADTGGRRNAAYAA